MPHPNCVCVSLNDVAFVSSNARGVSERSYLMHPSHVSGRLPRTNRQSYSVSAVPIITKIRAIRHLRD
jgi:hypothetical protein